MPPYDIYVGEIVMDNDKDALEFALLREVVMYGLDWWLRRASLLLFGNPTHKVGFEFNLILFRFGGNRGISYFTLLM